VSVFFQLILTNKFQNLRVSNDVLLLWHLIALSNKIQVYITTVTNAHVFNVISNIMSTGKKSGCADMQMSRYRCRNGYVTL